MTDLSAVAGLRRVADSGVTWDASASYGAHESDFFFNNTVNASLGLETPRDFDPGLYKQEEVNLNFDVSYAASDRVNLAAGTEWRDEKFTVGAADGLPGRSARSRRRASSPAPTASPASPTTPPGPGTAAMSRSTVTSNCGTR